VPNQNTKFSVHTVTGSPPPNAAVHDCLLGTGTRSTRLNWDPEGGESTKKRRMKHLGKHSLLENFEPEEAKGTK
jgi:hypothetical protein